MKVSRYVLPAEFDMWKERAEKMGFAYVASGPLVRSSYKVRWFLVGCGIRAECSDLDRLANTLSRICFVVDHTTRAR